MNLRHCTFLFTLFLLLSVTSPLLAQRLSDDFSTIRADQEPESLTRDNTYYSSNENELYLYFDLLKGRTGGIHIGVGTDPNYLFAGWAKPDALILFDFDQNIADVHKVYGILFQGATSREDFISLWKKESKERVHELIDQTTENKRQRRRLKVVWRQSRPLIERRFKSLIKAFSKRNIPTFLTDDKDFAQIVQLWKEGRVHSVRGDLTKEKTIQDISKLAKKHQMNVSLAYFSNAEYYFPYKEGSFAKNMESLPVTDDSLLLNTIARSQREYYYLYAPIPIYQAWVSSKKIRNLWRMQKYVALPVPEKENLFVINTPPPEDIKQVYSSIHTKRKKKTAASNKNKNK